MWNRMYCPKLLLFLFLLFLVGCTTPTVQCPIVNCKPCDNADAETNIVSEEELLTINKIPAGTDVYLVHEQSEADIINCGNIAHGPATAEQIKDIIHRDNLGINNLIIANSTKEHIGGCKDILIWFSEIKSVVVYNNYTTTDEFNDFIDWIPPNKLMLKKNESYNLVYNGHTINFNMLVGDITKTDGVIYK